MDDIPPIVHAQHPVSTNTQTEDIGMRNTNAVNAVPSSQILQFIAQETRLFHLHLQEACKKYEETGAVPASLFGVKAIRGVQRASGKKATAGERRKPTSFNLFIKKRIQELKQTERSDVKYTEIFKKVVEEWGTLTDEQKKAFAEQHAAELQGDDDGNKKKKAKV